MRATAKSIRHCTLHFPASGPLSIAGSVEVSRDNATPSLIIGNRPMCLACRLPLPLSWVSCALPHPSWGDCCRGIKKEPRDDAIGLLQMLWCRPVWRVPRGSLAPAGRASVSLQRESVSCVENFSVWPFWQQCSAWFWAVPRLRPSTASAVRSEPVSPPAANRPPVTPAIPGAP